MKKLEKKYAIHTSEERLYDALTNQTVVSQWSGAPAVMSDEEGADFSLWGGSIIGRNIKVTKNELVQDWKEKSWEGYSMVRFQWRTKTAGIQVSLVHENIPDQAYQNIIRGWDEHYMNPLITWIETNNL